MRGAAMRRHFVWLFMCFCTAASGQSVYTSAEADRLYPQGKMSLSDFSWSTVAFDQIAEVSFVLKNGNDFSTKDVEVVCEFYGNSGTLLNRSTKTVYDIVKKNGRLPVKNLSMGFVNPQAASANCKIAKAVAQ